MSWEYGSSCRAPALQVQGPEFKTLVPQRINLKKRKIIIVLAYVKDRNKI
jgi:hypothetical protein